MNELCVNLFVFELLIELFVEAFGFSGGHETDCEFMKVCRASWLVMPACQAQDVFVT